MRIGRSLPAIIATTLIAALPLTASAQVSLGIGFTIGTPPPPLPYYTQPAAPYPNYQWQPGYWAWGPAGYYWVPGTWVAPPSVGMYWTPGYWGYNNGYYGWNNGYWGATVGFYGGINYGYGYPGTGFYGGTWNGGAFAYNTAVVHVNRTVIHNTYNRTVINKTVCNNCKNVSYNGGRDGIHAQPTAAQIQARRNGRPPTTAQVNQAKFAAQDRNLAYNVNKGKPPVTAVPKPISDPKQLPRYQPVTAEDRHSAQMQAKPANATQNRPANATQNKPANAMQSQPKNERREAPAYSKPAHPGQPPSQMHSQGQANPQARPQSQRPQTEMRSQGQRPPPGEGKPPSQNDKNKPPRQ
jgi:hypothetical protein